MGGEGGDSGWVGARPPGGPYIRRWILQFFASSESAGAAVPPRPVPAAGDEAGASDSGSDRSRPSLTGTEFSVLYTQHHRALWCIAAAIVRDRDLAYDVVQEAAVIAMGKLQEFDPATSFPAWCGQIVRFVALNQRKRNVRSRVRSADSELLAAVEPVARPSAPAHTEFGFSGRLADALETLDETPRTCLLMKIVMDLSYRHIAETLGIPEGTAMSHVHRSRQVLRRLLEPGGEA